MIFLEGEQVSPFRKRADLEKHIRMGRSMSPILQEINEKDNQMAVTPSESLKSDYQMQSNLFEWKDIKDKPNFAFKKYKNKSTYKGEISQKTHQRNGCGVLIYADGRLYEGEWKADKRNGQGFEIFKRGHIYLGNFFNNKPHGKGLFTWSNGETYDGDFTYGSKTGYGVWKGVDNDYYMGQWRNDKPMGYGTH